MSGTSESSCKSAYMDSFPATSAKGYTKGELRACFYASEDCTTDSSSDYATLSGGDSISGSNCVSMADDQIMLSYRVTTDSC